MIRKYFIAIFLVTFCLALTGCYLEAGNAMLSSESSKEKIQSSDVIKIDVHNLTFNNDVDIYVENDKVGDISGKFVAIWDTLKFTDSNKNIVRTGKQNAYFLFDNWTVYDEDENILFIMRENFTLAGVSYDILDSEQKIVATLKRGAIQMSNSATVRTVDGDVAAEIKQQAFMNDFDIEFTEIDTIDKESLIIISTNYMMQKLYQDSKK